MSPARPSFDDLPLRKDGPRGNAWGLFGDDDECGMLNLLTPATTVAAAAEIADGVRISTDWALDRLARPFFRRLPFEQRFIHKAPMSVNDDVLVLNTQGSSQWDGFRHFAFQRERLWFNGRTLDELLTSSVDGIQAWVNKGGIVGRGVLLDYAHWAECKGLAVDAFRTHAITAAELDEVAASQGTTFRRGDILLIRTGWIRQFEGLPPEQQQGLLQDGDGIVNFASPTAIGVESSEAMLRWIWDHGFAAVAGDQPTLEAWPCQDPRFWLHEWLIAGWGVPIGELFDLEALGRACRGRRRWTFFFGSMPLKVPGGVASPPNGYAIL